MRNRLTKDVMGEQSADATDNRKQEPNKTMTKSSQENKTHP